MVTGTSRGIGTEFVKQLLERPNTTVIAGARSPDKADVLKQLKQSNPEQLHVVTLDVSDTASIQAAGQTVSELPGISKVDYLINNAALSNSNQSRLEESASLRDILEVNVVGVHTMIQTFLPLLQPGNKKTVVNISSGSGSLGRRYGEFASRKEKGSKYLPTSISYKTSKAALNMLTLSWASDVTPDEGFTFAAIHPGVVNTDMNTTSMRTLGFDESAYASRLTVTQSVQQLLQTITHLTAQDSGRFLDIDSSPIPF